jgi:hypothetical protein
MVNAKRLYVAILAITFLLTGSAVTWLVLYNNMPKKVPLRAKQVMSIQLEHSAQPR